MLRLQKSINVQVFGKRHLSCFHAAQTPQSPASKYAFKPYCKLMKSDCQTLNRLLYYLIRNKSNILFFN